MQATLYPKSLLFIWRSVSIAHMSPSYVHAYD